MTYNSLQIQIPAIAFGIILVFAICNDAIASNTITAAAQGTAPPPPPAVTTTKSHSIRINSPTKGQQVPVGQDVPISGITTGTVNATSHCQVSVIVNGIKPYHPANATGPHGAADYSNWKFVLTSNYTTIKEGQNKITARYTCTSNPNLKFLPESVKTFYSVNVTGVANTTGTAPTVTPTANNNNSNNTNSTINNATIIGRPFQKHTTSTTAAAVSRPTSQLVPKQPVTTRTTTTRNIAPSTPSSPFLFPIPSVTTTKQLSVTTDIAKGFITRGDRQDITVTVSNSSSNEKVAGAGVRADVHSANGLFKRDFTGTTDAGGQVLFSWKLSHSTRPGLFAVEVNATASGYDPTSDTRVFQVS